MDQVKIKLDESTRAMIRKYFYSVPAWEIGSGNSFKRYPEIFSILSHKKRAVDEICNDHNLNNESVKNSLYWACYAMDSEKSVENKEIKDGKIFHGYSEVFRIKNNEDIQKFKLFDALEKAGKNVYIGSSIMIKAKGIKPIKIEDPYIAGKFIEAIWKIISKDDLFDKQNIEQNRNGLFPGKGKKQSVLNIYRAEWIDAICQLLGGYNEGTYFVSAKVLYVNGHIFRDKHKTPKSVMDKNFFPADITKHIKSLLDARTNNS